MTDDGGLIEHFERTLGPIVGGFTPDADLGPVCFQVVQYTKGSDDDSVAYSTLGLHRRPLHAGERQTEVRQELLILAPRSSAPGRIAALLDQVGRTVHDSGKALTRGTIIGPAGPLVPDSALTALYAAAPVYFDDTFATAHTEGHDVRIIWLIPISTPEADYVTTHGPDAFEDLLVEQDPDLIDWFRPPIRLP